MIYDPKELSHTALYHLLTACIIPRPIALVTSITSNGIVNAAPFSFFNGVSSNPPILMIAVDRREGKMKDSAANILLTKEFVVNIVHEDIAEKMNICSKSYTPEISEIEEAGFTLTPSRKINVPGISESPIRLECKLHQSLEIGNNPTDLILGEVVMLSVDDALIENGRIAVSRIKAIGRLSENGYCKTRDIFEMKRLP